MENLLHGELTPERALNLAKWCWLVLAFVWIAMAFAIKRAKRRESIVERLQYTGLLVAGFLLLFAAVPSNIRWLQTRLLPVLPESGGRDCF